MSTSRKGGLGRGLGSLIGGVNNAGPERRNNPNLENQRSANKEIKPSAAPTPGPLGHGPAPKKENSIPLPSALAKRAQNQTATPHADQASKPSPSPAALRQFGPKSSKDEQPTRSINPADLIPGGRKKPKMGGAAADIMFGGQPLSQTEREAVETYGMTYREIPITQIKANPKQPRQVFDEEALDELVHSIKSFGLMQPIVVRPVEDKEHPYELIMGERRLRASTKAGFKEIPALIRVTDDSAMLRDALLENIHRVQLNPLEEAYAYEQLLEEFGVSQAELARRIGRSRPVITNALRLLQLPVEVQNRVAAGVLSNGHARAILSVSLADDKATAEARIALAQRIIDEGLSVRATEEAATLINHDGNPGKQKTRRESHEVPEFFSSRTTGLADKLDTKVSVSVNNKDRGRIIVEFGSREDFERIIKLL